MSTLQVFSHMLGRAMHLPDFFYSPIPLSSLLDTTIPVPMFKGLRRSTTRRRFKHARKVQPKSAAASASQSKLLVLEGEIQPGNSTKFAIGSTDFVLTPTTWVIGELRVGIQARVKGVRQIDDGIQATSIVMLAQ